MAAPSLSILGVDVNVGDKISFRVKHNYDKADHVGSFIGYLHFGAAKQLYDLAPYYRGLKLAEIDGTIALENMQFIIIQDDERNYFASAIDWIEGGSFRKIAQTSITIKVYNIEGADAINLLLQQIRNSGYSVKLLPS